MPITVDHTQVQIDDFRETGASQIVIPSFLTDSSISMLVVCIAYFPFHSSPKIESVSYNEMPLDEAIMVSNNSKVAIYYLINPGEYSGDDNIIVSINDGTEVRRACAYALTGTETSDVIDSTSYWDYDVNEGIGLDIETTTDGCIIIDILGHGQSSEQVGYETEVMNSEDFTISGAGSQYYLQPTAGLKTMIWTWSGESPAAYGIIAIKPAPPTPTNKNQFLLFFK